MELEQELQTLQNGINACKLLQKLGDSFGEDEDGYHRFANYLNSRFGMEVPEQKAKPTLD